MCPASEGEFNAKRTILLLCINAAAESNFSLIYLKILNMWIRGLNGLDSPNILKCIS